ncbi:DUF4157 domain-containing protein [Kribbella sp. NPDC049174]|uniref:eCIS core domain-containing protein n=1 Tax=Kribbella sp. NPDC049174 TaxID=3364112 RepID=UPI003712B960
MDDPSEVEADRRTEQILGSEPLADGAQRATPSAPAPSPPGGSDAGAGMPLPASTRAFFEPRLGAGLEQVRLHTDTRSADSAASLGARAYTVGNDIVFGRGEYAPDRAAGRRLLAHELVHVRQHRAQPGAPIRRQVASPATAAPPRAFADTLDYDRIAREVKKGVRGLGTDEEGVYRALQRLGRDPDAVLRLKDKYRAKYKVELVADLRSDFSGSELEYALQLINLGDAGSDQAARSAPPGTDAEWIEAAQRLRKAVEGFRTDEEAIYAVLLPFGRKLDQLNKLKIAYKDLYNEYLPDRLRSELSGSERDYALWLLGQQTLDRNDRSAEARTREVLAFIKAEAAARAKVPGSIDPTSKFYKQLTTKYLADYFASPTAARGKEAAEEKLGAALEGRTATIGGTDTLLVRVKGGVWRPVTSEWEIKAITWLNGQELPAQLGRLKALPMFANVLALPTKLGAATDILGKENTDKLPFLDIPFLIGETNPEIADFNADVRRGGKNISQLMHWATGVKYAAQNQLGLRELFLAYELWHLEGFEVFGQDSINDMIAENQGRMLGAELLKGSAGALKREADLLPFLNRSFRESRAWVGALLRLRRDQLDKWITAKEQQPATMHYMEKDDVWHSLTVYQQLVDGASVEDVKTSWIVNAAIEIYTLLFEADEWEKAHGPIILTPLEKALIQGKLDTILEIMAKAEVGKASAGDYLKAKSQIGALAK